jgi:hypothetical protein
VDTPPVFVYTFFGTIGGGGGGGGGVGYVTRR